MGFRDDLNNLYENKINKKEGKKLNREIEEKEFRNLPYPTKEKNKKDDGYER